MINQIYFSNYLKFYKTNENKTIKRAKQKQDTFNFADITNRAFRFKAVDVGK